MLIIGIQSSMTVKPPKTKWYYRYGITDVENEWNSLRNGFNELNMEPDKILVCTTVVSDNFAGTLIHEPEIIAVGIEGRDFNTFD